VPSNEFSSSKPPTFSLDRRELSRRAMLVGAAVGLSACSAANASTTGRRPKPTRTPAPIPTNPARDLAAVRVFPSYSTKTYGDHDAVLARLGDLGVKRMSHKITPAIDAATIAFTTRAYQEHGIKSWLTVGEPRETLTSGQWDQIVAVLTGPLAGMVERCYGWNEPNHVRGGGTLPADWAQTTGAHQAELWRRLAPLGIKVGTPQLWSGDFAKHDADLSRLAPSIAGRFDHIAWHLYPRGGVGVDLIDRFDATYRAALGDHRVVCTEAGYFTAPNYTGGSKVVSEEEQANYLPQLIDAYVSRGYGLSMFEFLNDPDPSGAEREAHFGLVRCPSLGPATWSNKPAFGAVKAHLA